MQKYIIISVLLLSHVNVAMSMESYDFFDVLRDDCQTVGTMCSTEAQEEQFGDIEVSGALAQQYYKALKEAGTRPRKLYYMTGATARRAEAENCPAISFTDGTWIHRKLFLNESEQKQEKIFRYHAYSHANHYFLKQVMLPIFSFYGGLTTLLYSSVRLIRRPTRLSFGLWAFGMASTKLGEQLKFGSLGKWWNNRLTKKAHEWSETRYII